jgi:DNA-binding transcriptional MerR regulator
MTKIPIDVDELNKMASSPAPNTAHSQKSKRAIVAEVLDKIEAARANGWPLDRIAEALNIKSGQVLSAYISSIKIAERKKSTPPPPPSPPAPAQRPGTLDLSKYDPSTLPPPPGSQNKPETDFDRLKRETDARLKERIAALQAESNQPKDVK